MFRSCAITRRNGIFWPIQSLIIKINPNKHVVEHILYDFHYLFSLLAGLIASLGDNKKELQRENLKFGRIIATSDCPNWLAEHRSQMNCSKLAQ